MPQDAGFRFELPDAVAEGFPTFTCSDARLADLANDMFRRHFFAVPGPSPYLGDQQTDWREWNALCSEWLDTRRHPTHGRDANADMAHFLETVEQDPDGYCYTYPRGFPERNRIGWPFPDYRQSEDHLLAWRFAEGACGWTVVAGEDRGQGPTGWRLGPRGGEVSLVSPEMAVPARMMPFVAVELHVGGDLAGVLLWESTAGAGHLPVRAAPAADGHHTLFLPLWDRLDAKGTVGRLALRLYPEAGAEIVLDRVECLFDTRHATNNSHFVLAAWRHACWGGDRGFLVRNAPRIRRALDFLRHDLGGARLGVLEVPWWGHDGRTGLGHGIGSNYWDLLPFGHRDLYGTAYYLGALRAGAAMEALLEAHPEWGASPHPDGAASGRLAAEWRRGRRRAREIFWDADVGRFVGTIDADGTAHDFGFVFANLEALHYGLGGRHEARTIYGWLDGARIVAGDTATGPDIYHWRFAPRATTRRNLDWYFWAWNGRSVPWGQQVQDGGAVLYTSYYDILNRLRWQGANAAWRRLRAVLDWYQEVQAAGGYRAYYADHEGSLQGAGTAGGLGIDAEFVESAMVPLVLLYGFLGVEATTAGLRIRPRLPVGVTELGVRYLRYGDRRYHVLARRDGVWVGDADGRWERRLPARGEETVLPAVWGQP